MRRILALLIVFVVLFAYPLMLLFTSRSTFLQVQDPLKVIGAATPVKVIAVNPHGVRSFQARLEQGGQSFVVHSTSTPAERWSMRRKKVDPQVIEFVAGSKTAPGVKDGKARLVLEAVSNDLRAKMDRLVFDVDIDTRPPVVMVDGEQHYINQGGAELVTFSAGGYWTEAGVRVGKYTFRSFAYPGRNDANQRLAFFAYPHDTPEGVTPVVYVRNPSGAEVTGTFWHKIFPKKFRKREIQISDTFLNKVLTELDPNGKGDAVARFTRINGDMRQQNNQQLSELRLKTADRQLWSPPFLQLANSQVEAQFCDYRTYFYQGNSIDQQVHLGFDLAVNARTPVYAANDGKVIFAGPLGIYGNSIVVDHGLAVQSLYSHLSEIHVKEGQAVKKKEVMGRTGATGMAGGDHLHFTMLVDGVPSNPVEWWDEHWLQDRVLSKLK